MGFKSVDMLKKILVLSALSVFAFCASCGGGSSGKDGVSVLVDVVDEPSGENCITGGKKIITGRDLNHNQKLEANEISDISYVCNGEGAGDIGPVVQITDIPVGDERCLDGGILIKIANDNDGNGEIIEEEVHQETIVCHNPSNKPAQHDNIVLFPEATSLIDLKVNTLEHELSESKADGKIETVMTFTVDGITLNAYGTLSVQGNSTAAHPKKNWKLRFYADKQRKKKLLIKVGDSVASNKWNFKAEWIDPTLMRNAVSYTLWESMVESRSSIPKYEVDNAWWIKDGSVGEGDSLYEQTSARGFPYAIPMQINMDGDFYGLGMLMTGHEPRNFNVDKNNSKHMYLEFEGRAGSDGKSWSDFIGQNFVRIKFRNPNATEVTEEQKAALKRLGTLFEEEENFAARFDEYFDKTNIIDMLLFMEAIYDWDSVNRDNEFATYDLKKWYILPWDKDGTFGSSLDVPGQGEEFEQANDNAETLLFDYEVEQEEQLLWFWTYKAFEGEVKERYASLREQNVFSPVNLSEIAKRFSTVIPRSAREAEYDRWKDELDGERDWYYELTSTTQLVDWFKRRLIMLDQHFGYDPDS